MSYRKWEHRVSFQHIEVVVPDQESMKNIDDKAGKSDDDFMSFLISSKKGVVIAMTQPGVMGSVRERIEITLTPEKARELAKFLEETTVGLV
jgi:hypothetical protein